MHDLKLIEQCVRWATIAPLSVLLWRWCAWGNVLDAPYFAGYLAVTIIDLAWNTHSVMHAMLIVPWQLSLLFCSLLESVRLCFPASRHRARRLMVLFMICFGIIGMSALGVQQYLFTAAFYRGLRQYTHVGLASTALFGIVFVAINGSYPSPWPLRHYLTLAAHLFVLASLGFLSHPQTMNTFLEVRIWYLASLITCVSAWLRLGSLVAWPFQSRRALPRRGAG